MASWQFILKSDDRLQNRWYRFSDSNNSLTIQTSCINQYGKCGTLSPGWMKGSHPAGIQYVYLLDSFNGLNLTYKINILLR